MRRFAKYDALSFKNPAEMEVFDYLQKIYLDASGDQHVEVLFDELNAYTISADVMTRYLEKYGKTAIFRPNGKRNAVFVSAFLAFAARYVDRLRQEHRALYDAHFNAGSSNRRAIQILFSAGERSYTDWTKALVAVGETPKESEDWFFTEYKRQRRSLGW